jgi:WD40 repeat protein
MADLFLSYAREDRLFMRRLHQALADVNRDVWVDWEDIPPSADWREEILRNIEAADTFVFVLSPHSLASEVCGEELAHAMEHHKRLVPVVYGEIDPDSVPAVLGALNWILFSDAEFEAAVKTLLTALDTDLEWVRAHTRLLTRAVEWERHRRDASFALRGSDLERAEHWLAQAAQAREPRPTELQTEYILSSRRDASRRQQRGMAAAAIGLIAIGVLAILVWVHRHNETLYLAQDFKDQAVRAMADHDVLAAEVLLAKALTLDDRLDTRERLLEARVRAARLLSITPTRGEGSVLGLSPDGRRFVLKRTDRALEVHPIGRGEPILLADGKAQPADSEAQCAAFSPDGNSLATGVNTSRAGVNTSRIDLWSLGPRPRRRSFPCGRSEVTCLAFSPDGRLLASGSGDGAVVLWDVRARKNPRALSGATEKITCLAFSPDGNLLAAGGNDFLVRLWKTDAGGKSFATLEEHEDVVDSLAFSPDGKLLASGGDDNNVWLWDVQARKRLLSFTGHKNRVVSLAFDAESRLLVSGSEDGDVRVWDLRLGRNNLILRGRDSPVRAVAFRRERSVMASVSENGVVRVWDLESVEPGLGLRTFRGHRRQVSAVAFSPDGRRLASGSGDGDIRLWDLRGAPSCHPLKGHPGMVASLAFSRDGKWLASGSKKGEVLLWDMGTGKRVPLPPEAPRGAVWGVEFTSDGRRLISGSEDHTLRAWDLETVRQGGAGRAQPLFQGKPAIYGTALSRDGPDGQRLAWGSGDGIIRLASLPRLLNPLYLRSGEEPEKLEGHSGTVWAVSFSPDGRQLVSSGDDGAVRLWNLAERGPGRLLWRHDGPVWDASFSPDGHTVASAGNDSTLRVGDTESGERFILRSYDGPVWWVAFSPDGEKIASGSQDRLVRVWSLGRLRELMHTPARELLTEAEQRTGLRMQGMEVVPAAR